MSTDLTRTSEIIDPLLWRDAQHIIDRHNRPDKHQRCVWCGVHWPCPPRRLADLAAAASSRPSNDWAAARHEVNDLRALARWQIDGCRKD